MTSLENDSQFTKFHLLVNVVLITSLGSTLELPNFGHKATATI